MEFSWKYPELSKTYPMNFSVEVLEKCFFSAIFTILSKEDRFAESSSSEAQLIKLSSLDDLMKVGFFSAFKR